MSADDQASAYRAAVTAAQNAGLKADPEAQLTTPVDVLFTSMAAALDIGTLQLVREHQLAGSRPDFGALIDGRFCGWIELKKPDTSIDEPWTWTGHNGRQWKRLAELDNLLVCNGRAVRRFVLGEPAGEAAVLPYAAGTWDPAAATTTLRQFLQGVVRPITTVRQLADRLAPLARDLRDRVHHALTHAQSGGATAAHQAHSSWRAMLQEDATEIQFADAVAQVITYGLVIVALEDRGPGPLSTADADGDGVVSLIEARDALRAEHQLLAAALGPILEVTGFPQLVALEVGAIEQLVAGVDRTAVRSRKDPRGEPWLWFYEDFLAAYDPQARREAGVYYTPVEVVDCMTRLVDDVLVHGFGKPLGFGDGSVTTLDPACGTGTFPLSVIDRAAERAIEELGSAGPEQVATTLGKNLFGFELLPGPFAVAHLRITERIRQLGGATPVDGINVLLADTLASPHGDTSAQLGLFGDAAVLAAERQRARLVKRDQPVMVVIGNPPYRRTDRDSAGGWVVHGDEKTPATKAPFAEVVEAANRHTIFSHRRSLYNLYTYFWRWAMWKAFETHDAGPAVVSFITGSSWISGAGFIGLRRLAEKHCDEIYVVDLGGSSKGAVRDENVFAIESPVAIVVLVRHARSDGRRKPTTYYRQIEGTRQQKLAALSDVAAPRHQPGDWASRSDSVAGGFVPATGSADWETLPALTSLMPWQQPGCIVSRLWPIAPDREVLAARWSELLREEAPEIRATKFQTAKSGRRMETEHAERGRLSDLPPGSPAPSASRYGWRAFDREWILDDVRVIKTEGPALWQSRSSKQIFLISTAKALGEGPGAVASAHVPDFAAFRGGDGGKDMVPLYRDALAREPNVTEGLTTALRSLLGLPEKPTTEDVAAYIYAVLATPRYQQRFADELRTPGLRVPLTAVRELWEQAVAKGSWLLWLHTYAERYRTHGDAERGSSVPKVPGLEWTKAVPVLPPSHHDIAYDQASREIHVGGGRVAGVDPEVWNYSVSGMQIVPKWLGYRTARGIGNAASKPKPLDRIRPETWHSDWNVELLDLLRVLTHTVRQAGEHAALLDAICDGVLIPAAELPSPTDAQRKVPRTIRSSRSQTAI